MILPIVYYGNPVLRQKGALIESITPEIEKLIEDMLETMYDANGVGLAAQQVGVALQLTVIDVCGADRDSSISVDGKPVSVDDVMPLVLLNPKIKPTGKWVSGPEGCLSFPEIYADITRTESVEVEALDDEGEPIKFSCGGLLAKAVMHEVDHLNGVLFIDRMDSDTRSSLKSEIEAVRLLKQ